MLIYINVLGKFSAKFCRQLGALLTKEQSLARARQYTQHSYGHASFSNAASFGDTLEQQFLQFLVCRNLELLADFLPFKIDKQAAIALAGQLESILQHCHQFEEIVIFPALLRVFPTLKPTLNRLRKEHLEDRDLACEVGHSIKAYVPLRDRRNSEPLGFMLMDQVAPYGL